MNNLLYENNYTQYVEPKYGRSRNLVDDNSYTENYQSKHFYSISSKNRFDMTNYPVYSIDPEG